MGISHHLFLITSQTLWTRTDTRDIDAIRQIFQECVRPSLAVEEDSKQESKVDVIEFLSLFMELKNVGVFDVSYCYADG